MMTSIHTMPMVSGTKRKWYRAVAANCSRDRSTSCSEIIESLLGFDALRAQHLRGRSVIVHYHALLAHKGPPQGRQNDQLDHQHNGQLSQQNFVLWFHESNVLIHSAIKK